MAITTYIERKYNIHDWFHSSHKALALQVHDKPPPLRYNRVKQKRGGYK